MTFQVVLHESGAIDFQYRDASAISMPQLRGSDATVGLENADGTLGAPYSAFAPVISFPSRLSYVCAP
jgi:hypothetical protein